MAASQSKVRSEVTLTFVRFINIHYPIPYDSLLVVNYMYMGVHVLISISNICVHVHVHSNTYLYIYMYNHGYIHVL